MQKKFFNILNKREFFSSSSSFLNVVFFWGVFGPLHHFFFPSFLVFVVSFVSNCCYMNKHTVSLIFYLKEICNVHWHFFNLCIVELFNVTQITNIRRGQKINRHTLTSKTSRTSNTMNVVLTVGGEIVVNDKRDLLDINTTC